MLLQSTMEIVARDASGSILAVSFIGVYPVGSQGNPHAAEMRATVARGIEEYKPSAVIIDLTILDYEFGNSIATVALSVLIDRSAKRMVCFVATGSTGEALRDLLEASGFAGWIPILPSRTLARAYLSRALRRPAPL